MEIVQINGRSKVKYSTVLTSICLPLVFYHNAAFRKHVVLCLLAEGCTIMYVYNVY